MPKIISVPLTLGRTDRVDPKFAPLGVLATAKNLRVRKDGRLACRNGYQPLAMTSDAGTVIAYDLHEYNGRLLALGSEDLDGFPADLFEYVAETNQAWKGCLGRGDVPISPFTHQREVAGVPQPEGGTLHIDAAAGGGYVCMIYASLAENDTFAVIVKESNDQVINYEQLNSDAFTVRVFGTDVSFQKVAYAGGKFFVQAVNNATNEIRIAQFTPGTSIAWSSFNQVKAADANVVTAIDLVPVSNPSTAILCSVYDHGAATDLSIKLWDAAGAQVGGTITVAGTTTVDVSIDADQTDNTIALLTIETATDARLRTFSFAGALVAGPTSLPAAVSGTVCRIHRNAGADIVVYGLNESTNDFEIQHRNMDTHGSATVLATIQNFVAKTRLLSAANTTSLLDAVVVAGLVGFDSKTNALFYVHRNMGHMTIRDYVSAEVGDPTTLTRDATTGKICWPTYRNPGLSASIGVPTVTMIDFMKAQRVQSTQYGGMKYFANATPWVYDGRAATEIGFLEPPDIESLTGSSAGGSLIAGATYTYCGHWEYTFSDGSFIESAPSIVKDVTLTAGQNRVTVVGTTPHSLKVALGLNSCTFVLSRTVWDTLTSTQRSELRRVSETTIPGRMVNYGESLTIIDQLSDATLSTAEVIYTEGERGPLSGTLEHNAPESCSYITATDSRIIIGGLCRPFEFAMSKDAFLGQPFAFSQFSSFYDQVSGPIKGVESLDNAALIFTVDDIFALFGDGPDDTGAGALGRPLRLATPSGLETWRSFVTTPEGLYFQLDDFKLYLVPRGGGSPTWVGVDIQDTLLSYPIITGACKSRRDDTVVFACQNTEAGTDGRIIVRSLRTGLWTEDTPPLTASEGIEAIVNFGDTVAYITGGVVYVQSTTSFADVSSTVIVTQVKTHPLYPFDLGGYGVVNGVLLTGEYRSAGTLALRVSYDDGINFTTYDSFTLSGLTVGQTIQRRWELQQTDVTSVVFEWTFTPSAAGEGFIAHNAALQVDPAAGQLKDLDPDQMA